MVCSVHHSLRGSKLGLLSVLLSLGRVIGSFFAPPFRFGSCSFFAGLPLRLFGLDEVGGDDEKLWFARLNGGGFNPACLAELKSSPSPSSPSSGPRSDPLLRFPRVF